MANEESYIHPVIQAIANFTQNRLAQQQLAATIQQRQQENQLRAKQLQQEEERIKNEHEHYQGMLQNQHDLLQSQLDNAKLNALKDVREMGGDVTGLANTGAPPQQTGSTPTLPGMPSMPTMAPGTRGLKLSNGSVINLESIPSVLQQFAAQTPLLAQRIGAQTQAQEEAKLPYNETMAELQFGHQKALQMGQQDWEDRHTKAIEDWQAIQKKLDRTEEERLANIRGGYELAGKKMEYDLSPEQLNAGAVALMTGQAKPNWTNPRDTKIATAVNASGARPLMPADAVTLQSLQAMGPVLDEMDNFANKLPSESKLGVSRAVADAALEKGIVLSPVSTDLQVERNKLLSDVYTIGKSVDSMSGGRIPFNMLEKVASNIANITTKEQAQNIKQYIQDKLSNRVGSVIEGGMPNFQQNLLYHTYAGQGSNNQILMPGWLQLQRNPNLERQGLRLNIEQSLKDNKAVYESQGQ